jgi:uncharacterized membrane protein YgcG
MRCPFCQNPCHEETAECSHCGFSLPKLDLYLGQPPAIKKGITDRVEGLNGKEAALINNSISRLEKRFPQVGFSVLLDKVKPDVPLHLYAFWIFNRSTLCASVSTGAVNRDILLTIDVPGNRASLMIGYGLEPFMSASNLTEVLDVAQARLAERHYGAAVLMVIDRLEQLLLALHMSLRRTYGAEEAELGIKKPPLKLVGPDGQPIY